MFKKLQDNQVNVPVGVIIGISMGNLINAFIVDIITPLLAAIGGHTDFSNLSFTINNSRFLYGDFINKLFIIGIVVYIFLVRSIKETISCHNCKSNDLHKDAIKCKYCCSELNSI